MSVIVGLVVRLLGLFGVSLSPFWAGAILAALVAASAAVGGMRIYDAGYASAEGQCEAAALRADKQQLEQRLAEKERQLAVANALQRLDAERAQQAEQQLRSNQEAIDATPSNPAKCFTRDMSRRVRNVR
jgi:hypothetical protein